MPVRPPTFRPQGQRTRRQANAEYDARRGNARQRGYTAQWELQSAEFRRAHPLCLGCSAIGMTAAAELTDHTIPHKGDMRLMWDSNNWQPACRFHHDVVKQRLEVMFAQGKIKAEDLALDSAKAIEMTRELMGEGE